MARNAFIVMLLDNAILEEIEYDPWGTVVNAMGNVVFAVHSMGYGNFVPFEYNVGVSFAEFFETHDDYFVARTIRDSMNDSDLLWRDVRDGLRILDRYARVCEIAGRSY